MKRRDFMIATGVSAGALLVPGAVSASSEELPGSEWETIRIFHVPHESVLRLDCLGMAKGIEINHLNPRGKLYHGELTMATPYAPSFDSTRGMTMILQMVRLCKDLPTCKWEVLELRHFRMGSPQNEQRFYDSRFRNQYCTAKVVPFEYSGSSMAWDVDKWEAMNKAANL